MRTKEPRYEQPSQQTANAKEYVAAPTGVNNQSEFADIGQQSERVLRSTGDASQALDRPVLEKVSESPMDGEYIAMMAFLREPVEIKIAENGDEQAEQVFEINVNGRLEFFRRGETKVVPRYIVDRLLRMKETRYMQKEVVNADGVKDIVHPTVTTLKYDFAITGDRNPLGKAWARAVRAEIG